MSRGNAVPLNKSKINGMKAGDEMWDSLIPGLLVRMGARGHSFQFAYTAKNGKRRKPTISSGSLEAAREIAVKWRDMVDKGMDPVELREQEAHQAAPSTLKDLERRWEVEAAKSEKLWENIKKQHGYYEPMKNGQEQPFSFMKPSTLMSYRICWKIILSQMGEDKKLEAISLLDIQNLHQEFSTRKVRKGFKVATGGHAAANKMIRFFNTAMQMAVNWGLSPDTDSVRFEVMFKKINRNMEYRRTRYLLPEELPIIKAGIENLRSLLNKKGKKKSPRTLREHAVRADQIEILLATGSRYNEFAASKLSWIDWSGPVKFIKLPDSKTGGKIIEIGNRAMPILKRLCEEWHKKGGQPGDDQDFILPSPRSPGQHLGKAYKGWRVFLKECGLDPKITPHTMRHTVLTHSVRSAGLTLEQAASIANHADIKTTAGYVQRVNAATVDALNKTTDVIWAMMDGTLEQKNGDDNDIPAYLKAERDSLKKIAAPAASNLTH